MVQTQTTNQINKPTAGADQSMLEMCVVICNECSQVCSATLNYCLRMDEKHTEGQHIKTLVACAEICSLNALWMSRRFDMHTKLTEACAEICEACANSCEAVGPSGIMNDCIEICQRCAESCKKMSAH